MHHAKGIIDRKTIGTKSKIRISTALAKHFEKNPDMQVTSTVRGTHRTEMVFYLMIKSGGIQQYHPN